MCGVGRVRRFASDGRDQHRMAFEANDMPDKIDVVGGGAAGVSGADLGHVQGGRGEPPRLPLTNP
jgi:hypothetical protein